MQCDSFEMLKQKQTRQTLLNLIHQGMKHVKTQCKREEEEEEEFVVNTHLQSLL